MCACVHVYVEVRACMCMYVYECVRVCVHVCMCVYMCVVGCVYSMHECVHTDVYEIMDVYGMHTVRQHHLSTNAKSKYHITGKFGNNYTLAI